MPKFENQVVIGAPLPAWSLVSIFGDEVPNLESFRGKPLVILIFNLGCPGCLGRAVPYANRLVYEHGEKLAVLGIHSEFAGIRFQNTDFEGANTEFHFRFPFFKDQNLHQTYSEYGAGGTPHWLIVTKDGIIDYSIFGSDPNNALLRLDLKLTELLDN